MNYQTELTKCEQELSGILSLRLEVEVKLEPMKMLEEQVKELRRQEQRCRGAMGILQRVVEHSNNLNKGENNGDTPQDGRQADASSV